MKELRKKAGIQQKELALIVGVAQPTVSEWELNKKDPSGERLQKLAEYFGVDELVILGKNVIDLTTEKDYVSEMVRNDPEIRALFAQIVKAKPEHIRAAAAMLKSLEGDTDD